jgi:hypothetical protein
MWDFVNSVANSEIISESHVPSNLESAKGNPQLVDLLCDVRDIRLLPIDACWSRHNSNFESSDLRLESSQPLLLKLLLPQQFPLQLCNL